MVQSIIYDSPKQFCIHGHNTHVTGRYVNHGCAQCIKDRNRRRRKGLSQKERGLLNIYYESPTRFCNRGHDTHETGRRKIGGDCVVCKRIDDERGRRRRGQQKIEHHYIPGLKQTRLALGLTQKELAERVGISRAHLGYIERGAGASKRVKARIFRLVAKEMARIKWEDAA